MLLFRPSLAAVALASSLGLHLHQVGRRTCTSKLLSMPSTQRNACGDDSRQAPLWWLVADRRGAGFVGNVQAKAMKHPPATRNVIYSTCSRRESLVIRLLRSWSPGRPNLVRLCGLT